MNRAMEFLHKAWELLVWWGNCEQARLLVGLAMQEVQECYVLIAELEAQLRLQRQQQAERDAVQVLNVAPGHMRPAMLSEKPCYVLEG